MSPLERPPGRAFVYVDCGARNERRNAFVRAFPDTLYIGFEPDEVECRRLEAAAGRRARRYFPVAAAGSAGARALFVTREPACSSLLRPNAALLARFPDLAPLFEVVGERAVETVTLDQFLPAQGIEAVDVLELDVQGGELDVLAGARRLLAASVLAVRTEVEFSPMYVGQPLFADVDRHLRESGFELFDLSRYRVRRTGGAPRHRARGQLLWGQALYLKDAGVLAPEARLRLAAIAAFHRFDDHARAVVETLDAAALDRKQAKWVKRLVRELTRAEPRPLLARGLGWLARRGVGWPARTVGGLGRRLTGASDAAVPPHAVSRD